MSYWIPTALLALVVLVLIAQLPWNNLASRRKEEAQLDLGMQHHFPDAAPTPEDHNRSERETVLS